MFAADDVDVLARWIAGGALVVSVGSLLVQFLTHRANRAKVVVTATQAAMATDQLDRQVEFAVVRVRVTGRPMGVEDLSLAWDEETPSPAMSIHGDMFGYPGVLDMPGLPTGFVGPQLPYTLADGESRSWRVYAASNGYAGRHWFRAVVRLTNGRTVKSERISLTLAGDPLVDPATGERMERPLDG